MVTIPAKRGDITVDRVAEIVGQVKTNLRVEGRTQEQLFSHLMCSVPEDMWPAVLREVRIAESDRVDIWVNGVVVEVKLHGGGSSKVQLYKQVERYAAHPRVEGIVVATNIAMTLPREINGKPARLVSLGRAWML